MSIRLFFKSEGINPEIGGPFYKWCGFGAVFGCHNFEAITLGFEKGSHINGLMFRPIDPTKPIVLAVDMTGELSFVYVDKHLEKGAGEGMLNHKEFKTDEYITDCQSGKLGCGEKYWSITNEGMTFVYGKVDFPGTWHLADCDHLCAFVGGEITANQLRKYAYFANREAVKKERREAHIRRLSHKLSEVDTEARVVEAAYHELLKFTTDTKDILTCSVDRNDRLVNGLLKLMKGRMPFISKANLLNVIKKSY